MRCHYLLPQRVFLFFFKTFSSEFFFSWISLTPGEASPFALKVKARLCWGLMKSLFELELFYVKISGFLTKYLPSRPFSLCTAGEVRSRQQFQFCPTSWVCFQSGSVQKPQRRLVTRPGSWCVLTRPPPVWRISWPAPAPSAPW